MQVRCCCGQSFTLQNVQYPYRVSCYACGRKLMVNDDGTFDEIRPRSIRVSCRCGQPFVVNAFEFPRKLRCVTCKRGFSVFDTGEIIDTNEDLPDLRAAPTAIEDRAANSSRKLYGSTAILPKLHRTELRPPIDKRKTKLPAAMKRSLPMQPATLHEELASIDARWRWERLNYAPFIFFGFAVFVPRSVLAMLGAISVALLALGWVLAAGNNPRFALVGFGVLMVVASIPGGFMLHHARMYEAAEADWLRRRSLAIEKYDSLT